MVCCFICPGFTNETLDYVKPVKSLDGCHLKGEKRVLCTWQQYHQQRMKYIKLQLESPLKTNAKKNGITS